MDSYYVLSIEKDGNGKLCWKTLKGDYTTTTSTVLRSVNPFPRLSSWLHWKLEFYKMKSKGELYKQCQGCGMGVAKFRIRDPNYKKGNERFNCCEKCIDFYDWRWSAMDIVGWKREDKNYYQPMKPICKKGSRCIETRGGKNGKKFRCHNTFI